MKKEFYTELHCLRGLAALIVLFYHCMLCFPVEGYEGVIAEASIRDMYTGQQIFAKIYTIILNGTSAVTLFLVLSGFVLARSLINSENLDIKKFYYKRFFRLYPAWLLSIIAGIFYIKFNNFPFSDDLTVWIRSNLVKQDISLKIFILNMVGLESTYNPGIWSMYYELLGSITLPTAFILLRKNLYSYIVLLLCFIAFSIVGIKAFGYLSAFYIAILLAAYKNEIIQKFPIKYPVLVLGIIIFIFSKTIFPIYIAVLLEIIGSCLIILYIIEINELKKNILHNKVFVFFGDISYSLYLFQHMIIILIANILSRMLSHKTILDYGLLLNFTMIPLSLLTCIIFSFISFKYIERPFILFSKKL